MMETPKDLTAALEHGESFVRPAIDLLKTMAGVEAHPGAIHTRHNTQPSYDLIVVVGITGPWKGALILSLNQRVAQEMVSKMMNGMPADELGQNDIADALAEFTNIVAGNALVELMQAYSVSLSISPPIIISGEKSELRFAGALGMRVVPFDTDLGSIELGLTLSAHEEFRLERVDALGTEAVS